MRHRVRRCTITFDDAMPGELELPAHQKPCGGTLVSSEHVVLFVNGDAGLCAGGADRARCEDQHEEQRAEKPLAHWRLPWTWRTVPAGRECANATRRSSPPCQAAESGYCRLALALAILAATVGVAACTTASEKRVAPLRPQPAVDVVLTAFEDHALVALSEGAGHGQLETRDFFAHLIRNSRFQASVRNIVIEFGNARYQPVMDRYLSGGVVARDELRQIWEQTTQISGVWSLPMYEEMLAETRTVNAGLPPELRMRVLLGDPPIDWSTVTSPADEDMNDWRDAHFAHVIGREVMGRRQKALILIGGAHVSRKAILPNSLIHLLDSTYPGETSVIGVVAPGRLDPQIKSSIDDWPVPGGAFVRDTWLGKLDAQQIGFNLSRGVVEDDVDALICLTHGPSRSQQPPLLDDAYRLELDRRRRLHDATLAFRGARIRFEENRAAFDAAAEESLHEVARELLRDRRLRLVVKAFADSAEADAMSLSSRRAALVVDWLTTRRVARERLVAMGCGARRPLSFGETPQDRAMNRRAELVRASPTAGCEPPW